MTHKLLAILLLSGLLITPSSVDAQSTFNWGEGPPPPHATWVCSGASGSWWYTGNGADNAAREAAATKGCNAAPTGSGGSAPASAAPVAAAIAPVPVSGPALVPPPGFIPHLGVPVAGSPLPACNATCILPPPSVTISCTGGPSSLPRGTTISAGTYVVMRVVNWANATATVDYGPSDGTWVTGLLGGNPLMVADAWGQCDGSGWAWGQIDAQNECYNINNSSLGLAVSCNP